MPTTTADPVRPDNVPETDAISRARAFVADVDALIEKHGFTIRVYRPGYPHDSSLAVCRVIGDRLEDVLLANESGWRPAPPG